VFANCIGVWSSKKTNQSTIARAECCVLLHCAACPPGGRRSHVAASDVGQAQAAVGELVLAPEGLRYVSQWSKHIGFTHHYAPMVFFFEKKENIATYLAYVGAK